VGDALRRFCRYHDLMADVVTPRLLVRGPDAIVRVEPRAGERPPDRHQVECLACLAVSVLRQLVEGDLSCALRFAHPRPTDLTEHRRIFGPSVLFDQPANELVLPQALLEQPIAAADAHLLGLLDQYADQALRRLRQGKPWSGRVADLLGSALCDGQPGLADVARQLALAPRSLQSRLKAEGTTFQAIADEVRRGLATAYLEQSDLTLTEITFLLGFADQSAFTRAFKKWTGAQPRRDP
jgi:AraC-like DNA-binding protein